MAWRDFKKKLKRQFSEFLELPGDVMLDLPKIVLIGNVQLQIENHHGIIEYTANTVRVAVGEGEVAIKGDNLTLRNLLPDELHIEGIIRSLSFD
ncbi:sporulation protein YqfC [Pelotomaculum isophthalicicum JI]|uniref:Sporulation protein YqfC n=1 Tax=Pelotomaculum isophthalicicum JI TaxID=947010 RepID=A0A9X4H7A1_9FIRM|nr:sporulation protein YqfC [Pelotomaculum isophthalicicum]MDF9409284.1 sporulation protein YqfC [Pelotomaculum isophthalicicum JI]